MRRDRVGAAIALTCVLASCDRTPNAETRPRVTQHVPPTASAIADAAPDVLAVADAATPELPESPSAIVYTPDATLVVVGRRLMLARAPDGTTKRRRLAEDMMVDVSSDVRGVVVRTDDMAELLATPSLDSLYQGVATSLMSTPSVLVVDDGRAVVLQQGDALLRLAVPTEFHAARPVSLTSVARGSRVNLAFDTGSTTDGFSGTLFNAKDGAVVGRGFAATMFQTSVALVGFANDVAFVIKGDRLSRVDLATAKVARQTQVACGKDRTLANPTPSPAGDLVLVTCDLDAIVFDGATLQVLRRIPRIMPGCDNGYILGGAVLSDNRTLVLGGCGGEARIDLGSGKYTCGDGGGIVGAPYEMFGGGGPPRPPTGRERLPRCTKEGLMTGSFGRSGRFRIAYGEHVTIESAGARTIELEPDGTAPVIAPDERSFAYSRGDRVVIRGLPAGELIAELRLVGP